MKSNYVQVDMAKKVLRMISSYCWLFQSQWLKEGSMVFGEYVLAHS